MSEFSPNQRECKKIEGKWVSGECFVTNNDRFDSKFNSMTSGSLIDKPQYLFSMDNENKVFGDFDTSTHHLDRTVSLTKDLGVGSTQELLKKEQPYVGLFYVKNKIVKKKTFYPSIDIKWKEVGGN